MTETTRIKEPSLSGFILGQSFFPVPSCTPLAPARQAHKLSIPFITMPKSDSPIPSIESRSTSFANCLPRCSQIKCPNGSLQVVLALAILNLSHHSGPPSPPYRVYRLLRLLRLLS
ncbi:unnamed protein product [Protopolystoma xenopodis]|uniref:Uncharacterized protein n=1 Tax=Protopolystoma xenopodis TaxID=117903 RepID=A0A3S5FFR5_9PLAT|nr:unnamed protein product [Protopolystoma xenopodis]